MILTGDMQPDFVAVGGDCFNKFWDLWPRGEASAADSAAKVTGQLSDPTFATNHVCCWSRQELGERDPNTTL
jgi:hypothetical protein